MKPTCGIVEATASGTLYAPEFIARGFRCIHVQPYPEMLPLYLPTFRPEDFDLQIIHRGDRQETLAQVRRQNPQFIVTGNELGVELSDFLSEQLGFPSNGAALSGARRDKFAMIEAIGARGLRVTGHLKAQDLQEFCQWSKGRYPVVIKPVDSAGTDGVSLCASQKDLEAAHHRLIGKPHRLGLESSQIIVEEYIEGPEYVLNTASWEGKHLVTDFWLYDKTILDGGHFLYDRLTLLPASSENFEALRNYTFKALDALGIRFGAAHAEVKMSKAGPMVVEIGARAHGGGVPAVVKEELGRSQVSVMAEAYCQPQSFQQHLAEPYSPKSLVMRAFLRIPRAGILQSLNGLDRLKALPTVSAVNLRVKAGDRLEKTLNLFNMGGVVYLKSNNRRQLDEDYAMVREIEADLFVVVEKL